jgi:hypothetical protein
MRTRLERLFESRGDAQPAMFNFDRSFEVGYLFSEKQFAQELDRLGIGYTLEDDVFEVHVDDERTLTFWWFDEHTRGRASVDLRWQFFITPRNPDFNPPRFSDGAIDSLEEVKIFFEDYRRYFLTDEPDERVSSAPPFPTLPPPPWSRR